jgi:hypothetical protein
MKKLIPLGVAIAAMAAMALAPSSASAVGTWGGWGSTCSHKDNAAAPHYWTHFGSSGCGDSQYCADTSYLNDPGGPVAGVENATLTSTYDSCSTGAATPLTFAGYIGPSVDPPGGIGCNHNPNGSNACPSGIGGVYVGTDPSNGVGVNG